MIFQKAHFSKYTDFRLTISSLNIRTTHLIRYSLACIFCFRLGCVLQWYSAYFLAVRETVQVNAVGPTLLTVGHRASLTQWHRAHLAQRVLCTCRLRTTLHRTKGANWWQFRTLKGLLRITSLWFGWKVIGKAWFRYHFLETWIHFAFGTCCIAHFGGFEFGPSECWTGGGFGFVLDRIWYILFSCWLCGTWWHNDYSTRIIDFFLHLDTFFRHCVVFCSTVFNNTIFLFWLRTIFIFFRWWSKKPTKRFLFLFILCYLVKRYF